LTDGTTRKAVDRTELLLAVVLKLHRTQIRPSKKFFPSLLIHM